MHTFKKQSAYSSLVKNAGYIFFTKLFPALGAVVVLVVYSRSLPSNEYGAYQDLWVKLLLIGTVAYAGLPITIITFSPDAIRFFWNKVSIRLRLALLGWCVLWAILFGYLSTVSLILGILLALMYVANAIQEALLMSAQKMKALVWINFFYGSYFILLHLYFLTSFNLEVLMWWLALGMLIRSALLSWIVFQHYIAVQIPKNQAEEWNNVWRLWLNLGLYDLLQTVMRYADKFVLGLFLSTSVFAIYFNGSQAADIPFLPYFLGAVSTSILLQLSSVEKGHSKALGIMLNTGIVLSDIVFPLFCFLLFFREELFSVVLSPKYLPSVQVFTVAIFSLPLRAYNYTTLLQHLHRGDLINRGALIDLFLVLCLVYPCYHLWGLPGVPLSFVIATYVQVGFYVYHIQRILHKPIASFLPLKNWMQKMIVMAILFYSLHYFVMQELHSMSVLIVGLVFLFISVLFSFFLDRRKLLR
ncbi:MAG: polysaccharide biosynthesis C-terminal domain-containing protein [Bacteroidetes bacterium]|nr:polysaccharide biosynthesis C-terminal domain-containing protein [Bacteroidota bacterium]